jgi:hypothetical protein
MRKRIYIACPISKGVLVENIRQADAAMLALMKAGYSPFNPALSCYCGGSRASFTDGSGCYATADRKANGGFQTLSHRDWLDMDFAWIEVCHAVLRLPGESVGADAEVAFARERGVPVFHSIDDLKAHFNQRGE